MFKKNIKTFIPLVIVIIGAVLFAVSPKNMRRSPIAGYMLLSSWVLCLASITISIVLIIKDVIQRKVTYKNLIFYTLSVILSIAVISDYNKLLHKHVSRAICGTHLSGLGKAMELFSYYHKDSFPESDKWCDELVLFNEMTPRAVICPDSDAVLGESSYAINKYLAGKKTKEVPSDTVVLFDTDYGKTKEGRTGTISSRYCYQKMKSEGKNLKMFGDNPEKQKVYKDRWNQSGGPELLTAEHHKGFGANILFADGSVRYIAKEDFNKLNWGDK